MKKKTKIYGSLGYLQVKLKIFITTKFGKRTINKIAKGQLKIISK